MLQLDNIRKSFRRQEVLKGISLELSASSVVALTGPNGSGKTTLMKSILGLVTPDSGRILFQGRDIREDSSYRSRIGYMPQISRFPENMKVGQLIHMMTDLRKKDASQLDWHLAEEYRLKDIYRKNLKHLSGGTRQKVSVVLAFLFRPDVLILDEPSVGLDPEAAEILKEKILESRSLGRLVLISSHIMNEVDELADSLIQLQEGRIRFFRDLSYIKSEAQEQRLGKAVLQFTRTHYD